MSLASILKEIVDGCGGGIGAALVGQDGIAIEQVLACEPAASVPADDVGAAGAEFGRILDEVRKASDALGGGALAECVVSLARMTLVLRVVDADTFAVLVLAPGAKLGKARYRMRRNLLALREAL